MKNLRLRDTALAALDGVCSNSNAAHRYRFATHSFNGWRCCPIPPLYKVLLGRAFSLRSPLRARELLSSPSFPHQGALALFALRHFISRLAAERICRQWNTSANILRFALHGGQRHGSTSSDRSGSEQEIVQLPDLYASATPHSLRSYGVCSVARSLSR